MHWMWRRGLFSGHSLRGAQGARRPTCMPWSERNIPPPCYTGIMQSLRKGEIPPLTHPEVLLKTQKSRGAFRKKRFPALRGGCVSREPGIKRDSGAGPFEGLFAAFPDGIKAQRRGLFNCREVWRGEVLGEQGDCRLDLQVAASVDERKNRAVQAVVERLQGTGDGTGKVKEAVCERIERSPGGSPYERSGMAGCGVFPEVLQVIDELEEDAEAEEGIGDLEGGAADGEEAIDDDRRPPFFDGQRGKGGAVGSVGRVEPEAFFLGVVDCPEAVVDHGKCRAGIFFFDEAEEPGNRFCAG